MKIFSKCFKTATKEDIEELKEYFGGYDYRGAGYTFVANYIWRESYCICWEKIGDYLCLAGSDCMLGEKTSVMAMPLTKNGKYEIDALRYTLSEAKKRFEENGIKFTVRLIPERLLGIMKEALPKGVDFIHDRDSDEYIYEKEKLITLSGRPLHKKKNHLNHFLKNYNYEVKKVDYSMKAEIMAFVYNFIKDKQIANDEIYLESLEKEAEAISELMDIIEKVDTIKGVAIYIEDKLEAFAIGEIISEDMAAENIEKANTDYRGLYQTVCMEFCKVLPDKIKYINREEDMGLEGLRDSKESLKPVTMERRYVAEFI